MVAYASGRHGRPWPDRTLGAVAWVNAKRMKRIKCHDLLYDLLRVCVKRVTGVVDRSELSLQIAFQNSLVKK